MEPVYFGFSFAPEKGIGREAWFHTYESAELFAECNCLDSSLISQSEEIDDEYLMDEITLPWTSDDVSGTAQKWRSEVATRNYFRLMAGVEALKNIDLSKLKLPER